jgi:predicted Zn-dependent protease
MSPWTLRKMLVSLLIAAMGYFLPWQQVLVWWMLPPLPSQMSHDPETRERQLRKAVKTLDQMGNVVPYGRGSTYIELAGIETARGRHAPATALLRKGLSFEAQPVDIRLKLVESVLASGGPDAGDRAAALLHDVARFASLAEAGSVTEAAQRLGLPDPWSGYTPPRLALQGPVSILLLGTVDPSVADVIGRLVARQLGAEVEITRETGFFPDAPSRFGRGTEQYDVEALARSIRRTYPGPLDRTAYSARIVLVDVDIFAFGLNFVFASMVEDGFSIVSLDRLRHPDDSVTRSRVAKQAMTSILDQLGASRPSHSACVNANTNGHVTFDTKTDVVCSESLQQITARTISRLPDQQSSVRR